MIPVEFVLGIGGGGRRRTMEAINLRFIVSTCINIIMCSPVQLLYANKIILKGEFNWKYFLVKIFSECKGNVCIPESILNS
jgi:hypothetical protein